MAVVNRKGFDDFIRLPNILIKSIGFDLTECSKSIRWTILMRFYMLLATISNLYCTYFIVQITLVQFAAGIPDLSILLRLISGLNYTLIALVKSINMAWFFSEYKKCCQMFYEIFPKTDTEYKLYQVENYFWPKWLKFLIYLYLGTVAFIALSPLGSSILCYVVDLIKYSFAEAKFSYNKLYEIPYSFDHHSPLAYIITCSIEVMHGHYIIIGNICPDICLLFFSIQLCMHFDCKARVLAQHIPKEKNNIEDDQFIASFVEKHLLLLDLSHCVNCIFSIQMLLMIISTTVTLCLAGAYTILQGMGRELVQFLAFLPSVIGQFFMICFYGQQIINKSENIGAAVYNHSWYNGGKCYKKSMLIILIRAQKQAELNAAGFHAIRLETFHMVMGATYRVFTLLQTMLDNK